jgi:hypothetical protein
VSQVQPDKVLDDSLPMIQGFTTARESDKLKKSRASAVSPDSQRRGGSGGGGNAGMDHAATTLVGCVIYFGLFGFILLEFVFSVNQYFLKNYCQSAI